MTARTLILQRYEIIRMIVAKTNVEAVNYFDLVVCVGDLTDVVYHVSKILNTSWWKFTAVPEGTQFGDHSSRAHM